MTQQQASELMALLHQIADDIAAIKAQGHAIAQAMVLAEKWLDRWDFSRFPPSSSCL